LKQREDYLAYLSGKLEDSDMIKNILISGGSGLIGNEVTKLLEKKGYQVAWLSRSPEKYEQKSYGWDLEKMKMDEKAIPWADAVIHLAGEGVADKRWTATRKKKILESRTRSSQLLHDQIAKNAKKPAVFVSASGINYYGSDRGDEWLDEKSSVGSDFLSGVVVAWEGEAKKVSVLDVRMVILRTGIVLDKSGGALKELMKPPIAAPLDNGDQWMSWIEKEDLARLYVYAIENEQVKGIYNAVGPFPDTNRDLTKLAAKKSGKPYLGIGVPGFALRLALGEMAEIVLGGLRVSGKKIQSEGFEFKYKTLEEALDNIYEKQKK
jgi:uncharacterized protein (TIGR01777 family)